MVRASRLRSWDISSQTRGRMSTIRIGCESRGRERVRAATGRLSIHCLLTFEVAALADWLECVASGGSCPSEITFIEPNLSFHQQSGALRVYFELEARPAWAASKEAPEEDLWLDFPASAEMLRVGAMALRHQLQRFPRRWASD